MTEEDTIRNLKKLSWDDLLDGVKRLSYSGAIYFIIESGWTIQEFNDELGRRGIRMQ